MSRESDAWEKKKTEGKKRGGVAAGAAFSKKSTLHKHERKVRRRDASCVKSVSINGGKDRGDAGGKVGDGELLGYQAKSSVVSSVRGRSESAGEGAAGFERDKTSVV